MAASTPTDLWDVGPSGGPKVNPKKNRESGPGAAVDVWAKADPAHRLPTSHNVATQVQRIIDTSSVAWNIRTESTAERAGPYRMNRGECQSIPPPSYSQPLSPPSTSPSLSL